MHKHKMRHDFFYKEQNKVNFDINQIIEQLCYIRYANTDLYNFIYYDLLLMIFEPIKF